MSENPNANPAGGCSQDAQAIPALGRLESWRSASNRRGLPGLGRCQRPEPRPGAGSGLQSRQRLSALRRDADPEKRAFTQGLAFDADGNLYEGTGKYGESKIRHVDLKNRKGPPSRVSTR